MRVKTNAAFIYCVDCGSCHFGAPCGMTYAQRLGTVCVQTEWMPAKSHDRQTGAKHYYDDEALRGVFGADHKERHEELMEDTKGVGFADHEDLYKHPELVDAHYLQDPGDEIDGEA